MSGKTKIYGLTGGIGTGKSTVAEYLKDKGFKHIDADQISRNLTVDGSPMIEVLDRVFGPEGEYGSTDHEILRAPGCLDRQALADLVFTDERRKDKLNDIMLTEIIRIIDEQVSEYRQEQLGCRVLLDAPLLFEADLQTRCDQVILVTADLDIRIQRVCARDGITEKQVLERISNQMSDQEKMARADILVDNSEDLKHLYIQLDKLLEKIC